MPDQLLSDALSGIAAAAVPEADLWPAISGRLATRASPRRSQLVRPRVVLAAAAVLVLVVGWTLVQPAAPGQLSSAQAADLARHDPQVDAILRGDVALVTVTSVVDQVATVVVQDSHGQQVTVTVNLLSRIVTSVYQGPQLSAALTARALAVLRADPRTSALLARGASVGRIMPIAVTYQATDPKTGAPTYGTETWAEVPLDLVGQEWNARVDLPLAKLDQLVDPEGNQVPLP